MLNASDATLLRGRYRIDGVIGTGGMGVVYRGHDLQLGRDVAIKMLHHRLAADPTARARFVHEARASARLTNPHIVAVFDDGEHDGVPFIVMELLPGATVADEIAAGALSVARARRIAEDMLDALGHAHAQGVVHRDIKPGNLLLTNDGRVKVSDFGIATSDLSDVHTTTGEISGSLPYIAPERVRGEGASPQSDLFSTGVVLYEALTATRPFARDTPAATLNALLTAEAAPVRDIRPDVDESFARAIEIALRKRPDARFAGATAMSLALGADVPTVRAFPSATSAATTASMTPPTAVMSRVVDTVDTTATRPPRRRPIGAVLLALGIALASITAVALEDSGGGSGTTRTSTPTTVATAATAPPPTVVDTKPVAPPPTHRPPKHRKHHGGKGG